ncbi:MAG: hypothetical protein HRT98_00360 [Mycoplasmatales bacterium]|nr:hypothetical protein [Mycoplasmatales bacterium]
MFSKLKYNENLDFNSARINPKITAITGVISIFITAIITMIFLRLTITLFGDSINGLTRNIQMIISYFSLADGGIGVAVLGLLYKEIAKGNKEGIIKIYSIAHKFFKYVSYIYLIFIISLALLMPIIIGHNNTISFLYIFLMVMVFGMQFFIPYRFTTKDRLILNADQAGAWINIFNILATILVYWLAIIVAFYCKLSLKEEMHNGHKIISVDGNSEKAMLLTLVPFAIISAGKTIIGLGCKIITRWKHPWIKVDKTVKLKGSGIIGDSMNGLILKLSALVIFSTDDITLSLLTHKNNSLNYTLTLISIYASYVMLTNTIRSLFTILLSPYEAVFARHYHSDEEKAKKIFQKLMITSCIFSIIFILLMSFNLAYLSKWFFGINSNLYFNPLLASIVTINGSLVIMRFPLEMAYVSTQKYKKIKRIYILEMLLNLILSLSLVWNFEVFGVAVATLISMLLMNFALIILFNRTFGEYLSKKHFSYFIISVISVILFSFGVGLIVKCIIGQYINTQLFVLYNMFITFIAIVLISQTVNSLKKIDKKIPE